MYMDPSTERKKKGRKKRGGGGGGGGGESVARAEFAARGLLDYMAPGREGTTRKKKRIKTGHRQKVGRGE